MSTFTSEWQHTPNTSVKDQIFDYILVYLLVNVDKNRYTLVEVDRKRGIQQRGDSMFTSTLFWSQSVSFIQGLMVHAALKRMGSPN